MKILDFKFRGYDNYRYEDLFNTIESLLADHDSQTKYCIAVDEAVCNALRYSQQKDINFAYVNIKLHYDDNEILTVVSSKTDIQAAYNILEHLKTFLNEKSWAKALSGKDRGRGFWMILEGVDSLYVEQFCQCVFLYKYRNQAVNPDVTPKILLEKFHIGIPKISE